MKAYPGRVSKLIKVTCMCCPRGSSERLPCNISGVCFSCLTLGNDNKGYSMQYGGGGSDSGVVFSKLYIHPSCISQVVAIFFFF